MSGSVERKYEKPLDYARVHADGAIVQINAELSRLIFYQETVEVDEDGRGIDNGMRKVVLKFEVRMPHPALKKLGDWISNAFKMQYDALNAAQLKPDDPNVRNDWFAFTTRLQSMSFDTGKTEQNKVEGEMLTDEYIALYGRLMHVKSDQNKDSETGGQTDAKHD